MEQTLQTADGMEGRLTEQLQAFSETQMNGAVLRLAKSDHVLWKKRLTNMILGRGDIEPATVASHKECRLGKWYYGPGQRDFGNVPAFRQLEPVHEQVHELGRRAVECYHNGDKSRAIADVEAIGPLSDQVVGMLDELIAESG